MYIRTSEFFSFKHIQYSTWCQNRGCICISSTRRTYRLNPAVYCIHPVIQTRYNNSANRIISLRIGEERFFPVFPHEVNYSTYRINSSTRILQEILQLQSSSCAGRYKASSSNCTPCIQAFYMVETLLVTL